MILDYYKNKNKNKKKRLLSCSHSQSPTVGFEPSRVSYLTTQYALTISAIRLHVFFITYKLGTSQCQKLLVFDETRYSDVFGIDDYEYELRI